MSKILGVRGAITVRENTKEAITFATQELLEELIKKNNIFLEDIVSCFFTLTPDLDAEFPAVAARNLGWKNIALMCAQEVQVPDALPQCIRVLIHWNTSKKQEEIKPVYLREAVKLRPDLI